MKPPSMNSDGSHGSSKARNSAARRRRRINRGALLASASSVQSSSFGERLRNSRNSRRRSRAVIVLASEFIIGTSSCCPEERRLEIGPAIPPGPEPLNRSGDSQPQSTLTTAHNCLQAKRKSVTCPAARDRDGRLARQVEWPGKQPLNVAVDGAPGNLGRSQLSEPGMRKRRQSDRRRGEKVAIAE